MSATPLLSIDQLAGGYGDTIVLRGISAAVQSGEVLGVLGRNGVGKSTLMRLLMGYLPSAGGAVVFDGADLRNMSPHARQRRGISHAPQERVVFDTLSVRDNLTLHRSDRSLDAYAALLDEFPRIAERLAQPAGVLSGGEKKLVSFCRVMAENAALTLMDEPTEGVQAENIDRMARCVAARAAQGAAFVIVEQNLTFLQAVMHQILVLDHGEAVGAGPAEAFDRAALEAALHV